MDPARIEADLLLEGESEKEFHAGVAERFPRKTVAGGALLRDSAGRILFVVPTYKPVLDIPGGIAEENEPAKAACVREVGEELGLSRAIGRLLVVDWTPAHGPWRDSVQFVFDGGLIEPAQVNGMRLDDTEVSAVRFLTLAEARPLVRPSMARRLALALAALDDGETVYAEFGRRV